jgi:ribonuclease HI
LNIFSCDAFEFVGPHVERSSKPVRLSGYAASRGNTARLHKAEEGGIGLLNLSARNEAIDLIWLKLYLNFSPTRPAWAAVTDIIISAVAPPSTIKELRTNPFLQCWNAPVRGARSTTLNSDIRRMLKVAKKYDTNLAAIRMTEELRAQLPAWYHPAADPCPINNRRAKCLIDKHKALTVADLLSISTRQRNINGQGDHRNDPLCPCIPCSNDRLEGCTNPAACALEALTRAHKTFPKYNPLRLGDPHDNLSLTITRKGTNESARQNDGLILFDPTIMTKTNLADCFRVFTDPERISKLPAQRYYTPGIRTRGRPAQVYTDGACFNNGKLNAQCGGGVWFDNDDARNAAIRIPGDHQSNQVGEIAAVIKAVTAVHLSQPLTIVTDSKYVIDGLTKHLSSWEDKGWIGVKNATLFKKAAHVLKRRTATTHFQWVKGHEGTLGNEESDRLAKEGARKTLPDPLELTVPKEFDLQGARLPALTQSLAYKGILQSKDAPPRRTTTRNLQMTREAVARYTNALETDQTIWKGIRRKAVRTRVRQFLYKSMHGTQKIGTFWKNINNHEHRQDCGTCGTTESMAHILVHCDAPSTRLIWSLAKHYWPQTTHQWPEICLGTILGCGSLTAQ